MLGIVLLLWGLVSPAMALPPSDSPGTGAFAQDATGTVWALPAPGGGSMDGTLRRWSPVTHGKPAGTWAEQAVPGTAGFRARVLTRGEDGSVYTFWQTFYAGQGPPPQCLVTVQRGLATRILARFSEAVVQDLGINFVPMLAADAGGDVWLAGYRPFLWHITSDGTVIPFTLTAEQHFGGKLPEPFFSRPIFSLRDGRGRRWFWQSSYSWQPYSLRGVLIWDGKSLAYHPTISEVPDRPFAVLASLDADHIWLATAGDDYGTQPVTQGFSKVTHGTLYRVDTHTLTAVAETVPPGDLQNIVQVFQANGDWYALDQKQNDQPASLWREEAGHWRKRLDKIEDFGAYYRPDPRHPWLAEPSGAWLGVNRGAWWLPHGDKPPLWINWRRGLAPLNIIGLFPLTNGSILAVGPENDLQQTQLAAAPQPIQPLPPGLVDGGMGAPANIGPVLADARHHLWGAPTFSSGPRPLYEWDGKRWRTHVPPESVDGVQNLYACDTLGRIWLTTSVWHPPAMPQPVEGRAVYDPVRDAWTVYRSVADALQASAGLPRMAFLPHYDISQLSGSYQFPVFSGDGRVTYTDGTKVSLYEGHAWHNWATHDILPNYPFGNPPSDPRFNAKGRLEIALAEGGPKNQLWEWAPAAGWQRMGEQTIAPYWRPVPPNGPRGLNITSITAGEEGAWFVWQGVVYTLRAGLWAKQAELSGLGSPFHYGVIIENVLRDPFGRLFFVTRPAGSYDLVVWSPPPVPKMTLTLIPAADDAVTVRFRSPLRGPHWFQWRLNGGAWSAPQTADTVALTALPHGDYRLEAQALDKHLQSSPTVVAVFSIRVATDAQIAHWVQTLLSGTDDQSEAAVAGLIKQPDAALPALRAAQSGASESGRWWLDAAIQEIMQQNQAAGSAGQ